MPYQIREATHVPNWVLSYLRSPLGPFRREPKRVFFLHLPKCAGTSVWAALRQLAGRERTLQIYNAERAREFAAMDPAKLDYFRAIGGHFTLESYRARLDLKRYFSITTFREPVERVVSEYYYTKSNPKHSHHQVVSKLSLRDFIDLGPNPITKQICGRADAAAAAAVVREVFDDWAFVDQLPSLITSVCRHLGKPVPPLRHINAGPLSLNAIAIDEEDRALIVERHAADVELYRMLRNDEKNRALMAASDE